MTADAPYSEMFGYSIHGMVDPSSSAFAGTQDYPAATPSDAHCVITWDFHRL
jgi:hypothetical protein